MIFYEKIFLTVLFVFILLIFLLGIIWLFFLSYIGIKEVIVEHKKKIQEDTINE